MLKENKLFAFLNSQQKDGKVFLLKVGRYGWSVPFIDQIILYLITSEKEQDFQFWQKKVVQHQYFDVLSFQGKKIKKDDLKKVMEQFYKSGIEKPNKKFLIIKNVELCSKIVLNALLKFCEEPPQNTYCIFTTNNDQAVLPTIVSRAIKFHLPCQQTIIDQYLAQKNIDQKTYQIATKCFFDFDQIQENWDSLIKAMDLANIFIENKYLSCLANSMEQFKKMTYEEISIFLKILIFAQPNHCAKLSKLLEMIYLNPNKVLLFNQVLDIFEGD